MIAVQQFVSKLAAENLAAENYVPRGNTFHEPKLNVKRQAEVRGETGRGAGPRGLPDRETGRRLELNRNTVLKFANAAVSRRPASRSYARLCHD